MKMLAFNQQLEDCGWKAHKNYYTVAQLVERWERLLVLFLMKYFECTLSWVTAHTYE